jgi:hypothetical protein
LGAGAHDAPAHLASLLTDVGNVYELANLLTSAAYAALCLGSERDATDFAARATPITSALDDRFVHMINTGNPGLAALLTGDTDTGWACPRGSSTGSGLRGLRDRLEALDGLLLVTSPRGAGTVVTAEVPCVA